MNRAVLIVLDSLGIGYADDAGKYGDVGADTLGHIVEACPWLKLPNLSRLGLQAAAERSRGKPLPHDLGYNGDPEAAYGYAVETSIGKDTPSGHWEIACVPVKRSWGYFHIATPAFPDELISQFVKESEIPGVLGNKHASGTTILDELGEEHIKTGRPIVYTSVDSVFQIAAHEEEFGLDRLYEICKIARRLVNDYNICRVIARPFLGDKSGEFVRTGSRKDYATPPSEPTLLDRIVENNGKVISIGKVADVYANRGITQKIKATGIDSLFEETLSAYGNASDGTLIFTNFVDFDSEYGHRRDPEGYAAALEKFDRRIPELLEISTSGDLLVITADHGCDPVWKGTDHTREHVPVIFSGPDIRKGFIGRRESFADIGQTIAQHMGIPPMPHGTACNIHF